MKKYLLLLFISMFSLNVFAQSGEFKVHDNGLIYNDNTVAQLKFIVDSLNLQFKSCEPNKEFKTLTQSLGHFLDFEGNKAVKKDIEAQMPFDELVKKHPKIKIQKHLVLTKDFYEIGLTRKLKVGAIPYNFGYGSSIDVSSETYFKNNAKKGDYLLDKKGNGAFYLLEDFESASLDEKYSLLVQYVDCLVDTSSQVIYKEATGFFLSTGHEEERPSSEIWEKIIEKIESKKDFSKDKQFLADLETSADFYIKERQANELLENNLLKYGMAEKSLELKRLRRVEGMCSMDNRPRVHAQQIAVLAAETVKWDVFLRAHLNIMNDRFNRVSDGSWAWAGRKTYIRELEELDIEVADLLLGASLRIENPSPNHYYASIGRTGRALVESQELANIETQILDMIMDEKLDNFNRMLMYFLFRNMIENLEEPLKSQKVEALQKAVNQLPKYMSNQIDLKTE